MTRPVRTDFIARDKTSQVVDKIAGKTDRLGSKFAKVGRVIGAAAIGAGAAVGAFAVSGVRSFLEFDDKLNQSIAIMGKVSGPMRKQMEEAARSVGKTTRFSASQAAESYFFLASAGLDAAASVKAMPVVAKFAQAGMFDMALATDLATDAQSALGLTSKNATKNLGGLKRVTDVLVKANTLANASVVQFSESLTNKAGAALRTVNKDVEEGVAVLAALADQGIKGTQAGEKLSIVMRDLQTRALKSKDAFKKHAVAVFDSNGKMRNMADIIADVEKALKGKTDAQKKAILAEMGFADESVNVLLALIGTSEKIRGYEKDLRNAGGTTDKIAKNQMKSFQARLDKIKSAAADVALGLGKTLVNAAFKLGEKIAPLAQNLKDKLAPALGDIQDKVKAGLGKIDISGLGADFGKEAAKWSGKILTGIQTGLDKGEWGPLGKTLGDGLGKAIGKMGSLAKGFGRWVESVDWVVIGKGVGGKAIGFAIGFLAGLGDDLFTAEFWKKHWWDVVLAGLSVMLVGKAAGPIGKVLKKIPILKWFAPFFEKLGRITEPINKVLFGVFRWFGRHFSTGFRKVFPEAAKGLRKFFGLVTTWIGVRAIQLREWAMRMIDKFLGGFVRALGAGTGRVVQGIGKVIALMLKPFVGIGRWLFKHGSRLLLGLRNGIWNVAKTLGSWLRRTIWKPISDMLGRVRKTFSNGVTQIGRVWNRLRGKARRPVQFVIDTVYNRGIRRLWNKVNNIWGGKDLSPLRFAKGGVIPMVVNRPTAIVGEGNTSHPEYVIPTDPQHRKRAIALYESLGAQLMANGGIIGLVKSVGGGLMDLFSSPAKTLRKIFSGALGGLGRIRDTAFGRGVARIPGKIVSNLIDKAKGLVSGGGGLGRDGSTSVGAILALAKRFYSGARVSSGLRSTRDYHGRGLAADLVGSSSGMARMARGFYAISGRLLELIHSGGGGYFVKHGRRVGAGFYGREVANHWDHVHVAARRDAIGSLYDKGGMLPPGVSTVVNRTREPEAVLTGAQWSAILAHLSQTPEFVVRGDNSKAAAFIVAVLKEFVRSRGGNVQKAITGKAA